MLASHSETTSSPFYPISAGKYPAAPESSQTGKTKSIHEIPYMNRLECRTPCSRRLQTTGFRVNFQPSNLRQASSP